MPLSFVRPAFCIGKSVSYKISQIGCLLMAFTKKLQVVDCHTGEGRRRKCFFERLGASRGVRPSRTYVCVSEEEDSFHGSIARQVESEISRGFDHKFYTAQQFVCTIGSVGYSDTLGTREKYHSIQLSL